MLPKHNRLPSPLMRLVLRTGRRITTNELQLVYSNNTAHVSRFAFIVGTNIDKRATARNRIKRLLRESIRNLLPKIKPGLDVIILVRKSPVVTTRAEVWAILNDLFLRASIINNGTI